MYCPKCKLGKLEEKTFGVLEDKEIKIDICFLCNGIWFDKDELKKTLQLENKPVETKGYIENNRADIKYDDLNCPRCSGKLIEQTSKRDARITIDICEECNGIWLDCGELNSLQDGNFLQRLIKKMLNFWDEFGIYRRTRFTRRDAEDLLNG